MARKGQEGMPCGEVRICCVWFQRTHMGIAPYRSLHLASCATHCKAT